MPGVLKRSIEGSGNSGVHVFWIVDDENTQIQLEGTYNDLKTYVPAVGSTKELYSVEGTLKRDYKKLYLEVNSISPYERQASKTVKVTNEIPVTEQQTIELRQPKYPMIRNMLFKMTGREITCEDGTKIESCSMERPFFCSLKGLKENPTQCGCPSGQREYNGQCIQELRCSDQTFSPECSKTKPKQCIDGNLIDNPELCGCPPETKFKKGKCVNIKCSDGTLEPDCSERFEMQCIEGKFVYNAKECGCPDNYKKNGNTCIQVCKDGTPYNECSNKRPLFCDSGALINKSEKCGCGEGESAYQGNCESSEKVWSIEGTDYLNEIRAKYGRKAVKWDERLYELAMFRAKDMYDRGYFDHVTPEGECVKDFKKDYGLQSYDIAENAGAVTYDYGYGSTNVKYVTYFAGIKDQIDGWMDSRGHRYNLLYSSHVLGVAACYGGACVFLGANNDGYGSGPCSTGEEGMAFWEDIGKQPGEV